MGLRHVPSGRWLLPTITATSLSPLHYAYGVHIRYTAENILSYLTLTHWVLFTKRRKLEKKLASANFHRNDYHLFPSARFLPLGQLRRRTYVLFDYRN